MDKNTIGAIRTGGRMMAKFWIILGIVVCFIFGLPFLLGSIFGEMVEGASRVPGVVIGAVFTLAGLFLIFLLIRMNAVDKRLRTYIALIGNLKKIELSYLGERLGKSSEQVISDIYKIKEKGYLTDAHIDRQHGLLLFPNTDIGAEKSVKCENCGAIINILQGYAAACPYCGMSVKEENQ